MNIKSIHLKNIGIHSDIEVDFEEQNIIAICGKNGAGKTTLLESLVAGLYGVFPTRPGSVYDMITEGFIGTASILIEFEMYGNNYQAKRILNRTANTTTATAELNVTYPDGKGQPIAGPKITDFQNAIVNLLGDKDTFMASAFNSQMSDGDITTATASERKALLAKMIGLEQYAEISDKAKEKAKGMEQDIKFREVQIEALKEQSKGYQEGMNALAEARADQAEISTDIVRYKETIERLEAELKAEELEDERCKGIANQINAIDKDTDRIEQEIASSRKEWQRLNEIVTTGINYETVSEVLAIKEKTLKTINELFDKYRTDKENIDKENAEIDKYNIARENQINQASKDLMTASRNVMSARSSLEKLKQQASLIQRTPNQECCKGCELVASAMKAQENIPIEENTIKELQTIEKQCEGAVNAAKNEIIKERKDGNKEAQEQMAVTYKQRLGIEKEIEALKLQVIEGAKANEYRAQMEVIATAGISSKELLRTKLQERQNIHAQLMAMTVISKASEISEKLQCSKIEQSRWEKRSVELQTRIGTLEGWIASIVKAKEKLKDIEQEITADLQVQADYKAIQQAFGKSGIPQLLIEEARPEIENTVNELLQEITGGAMRVRISTQKELKSGDMSETLDIVVTHDGVEYDIERLSGGEKKIVRLAIRLALAIWRARKGGSKIRTVMLDEAMENMDSTNKDKAMDLLASISKQFDRVIVISHDDEMVSDLPCRINITKSNGRTKAELIK